MADDLCAKLRRNDPSVKQCSLNVTQGAEALEALKENTCVTEIVITLSLYGLPSSVSDPERVSALVQDLVQFLKTTERFATVWFHHISETIRSLAQPLLVNAAIENPLISELKFASTFKLTTEQVVGILRMPRMRKLHASLYGGQLDAAAVADAFGANTTLERINLFETDNLSAVEAVLPRLGPNPALKELYVFGCMLGPNRVKPRESTPPNSVAVVAALVQTLATTVTLTQLYLLGFVFDEENMTALVLGLKENQTVSWLGLQACWFSSDGCVDIFVTFMKSINVTNPNFKHLDILGCEIKGWRAPTIPPMLVQAPLQVLEMGDHIQDVCAAWASDPNAAKVGGLILRHLNSWEWTALVQSLPAMKSLRDLTITQLEWSCNQDLIVEHMRHHWNIHNVVLQRHQTQGDAFLDEERRRLVDAFAMRNKHVPGMLAKPISTSRQEDTTVLQGERGRFTLRFFPSLFQTGQSSNSKPPHVFMIGLLAGDAGIGQPKKVDLKRSAADN